ncbi:DMT family transporter [Roseovarius spongiae]|uniref:DMT family transporter n=1 Tax=Roseovarius spongiae TaxID=2320272 RepID=A0A3A8ART0_9RHOB|nr:DMT family transporter [Roseovarius spongiae]RKF12635.1 DMT family transporter [Roseovarius spongiae]
MSRTGIATGPNALRGIVMMCLGMACLAINDAFAKYLTDVYSPVQILFLRNLIALPFAVIIAVRLGGWDAMRTRRPGLHLLRGTLWLAAATLFFTGLRYLGLAEATVLIFAAPVIITGISALFLGETVGWRRWSAVLVGLVGVIVVVRPGGDAFQAASLFPLATAFLYAILMISSRWVPAEESLWTTMVFQVLAAGALAGLASLWFWTPVALSDLWLFIGIALAGTLGMTLITEAFRFSEAAVVAPFDYTALIWATLLGYLIWNETPDAMTWLGAAIIIGSGIFIILREARPG